MTQQQVDALAREAQQRATASSAAAAEALLLELGRVFTLKEEQEEEAGAAAFSAVSLDCAAAFGKSSLTPSPSSAGPGVGKPRLGGQMRPFELFNLAR